MLAYAANRPVIAERRSAPNALLAIIAAHVALVAVVMSAKMDLPQTIRRAPLIVNLIPEPAPPPARHVQALREVPEPSPLALPQPLVPTPPSDAQPALPTSLPGLGALLPPEPGPPVGIAPQPRPAPVRVAAQLVTPPSELRPPYPERKLAAGEEAVLRLRLSIDERGRVTAVEPVGRADRIFLEAARRYLIAHWRYTPASEDGRAVGTTTVVTLRFQLDA